MTFNGLTLLADTIVFGFVVLCLCFLCEHWHDA